MTSETLDNLRITIACEILQIKADLLNLTECNETKRLEKIRRLRDSLSVLGDKINADYKQMTAFAREREREMERLKIQARIKDLKAEINELEAKL